MIGFKFVLLVSLVWASEAFDIGRVGRIIGGETRNVFVTMSKGPDSIIDQIDGQSFPNREAKITALTTALKAHSQSTQGPVLKYLGSQSLSNPIKFESMWISNVIYVTGVNSAFVSTLQTMFKSDIASIEDEPIASLLDEIPEEENVQQCDNFTIRQANSRAWGISKVQAPNVWNMGNRGEGIIVGVIDTGARGTHETLRSNFVGSYGWYDPSRRTSTPNDQNGHGTHTTGTIVGSNGIGVAPGAKWMHCKGCAGNSCSGSDLVACGQFMLCPTDTNGQNQNCGRAPHLVSNSWGGGSSSMYNSVIRSWRSAGIIPIFSIGNSGPRCSTTGSPGNHADVIGVGSTTRSDTLSDFSSKGPSGSLIKPDVSAPGSDVYSAWMSSDTNYRSISGTSMACPHVAGVVALMLKAKPGMTYDQVKSNLLRGCVNNNLRQPSTKCTSGSGYPNNEYGQGVVNALNSVRL